jgi:hypothetical protein
MSSNIPITDQHHNDFVGTDANKNRIPGADQATSGHQFESVFPKGALPSTHCSTRCTLTILTRASQSRNALRSISLRQLDAIVRRGTTCLRPTPLAVLVVRTLRRSTRFTIITPSHRRQRRRHPRDEPLPLSSRGRHGHGRQRWGLQPASRRGCCSRHQPLGRTHKRWRYAYGRDVKGRPPGRRPPRRWHVVC